MTNSSSSKCALVTGSSNGIGEAIVLHLAKLNFKLVVTGRNSADIKRVADECERVSPSRMRPLEVSANLEQEADIERLFSCSMDHFERRLDVLVNNAGLSILMPDESAPGELYGNFKRVLQVNLSSAVQLTLLACEALKKTAQQTGTPSNIINVSSIGAYRPLQDFAYCTSKAAMSMFTNCMVGVLGPHVRVNTVAPGPIETKIIERSGQSLDRFRSAGEQMAPMRRIGNVDEVAQAVAFLVDPERAAFISGAQLVIDGGLTWAQVRW